jgi:hypothetical protein
VSPVKYELGFHIPQDDIPHNHRRDPLKSCTALTGSALSRRRNVSSVRYEVGFHIPEDGILHSHRRDNVKSYIVMSSELHSRIHHPTNKMITFVSTQYFCISLSG